MSQDFFYPPGSSNVINIASEGPNNAPIPTSSTLIGGENPSLNLQPLQTDASGNLKIVQGTGNFNENLVQVGGVAITLGQKTSAASLPVVFASDQSALSVTGPLTDTQLRATAVPVSVSNFPATQSVTQGTSPWVVSGTVTANAGTGTFAVSAASLPLPTGASTEATLSSLNGKFNSLGQKTSANSAPVVLASDQTAIPVNSASSTTSGTVTQAAVAVGTSAVRCTVSGSAPNAARKALIVEPDPASTAKFYIGSSSVANSGASRGVPLAPGAQFIADFDASDFYIISDTAAQTFFVVEEV